MGLAIMVFTAVLRIRRRVPEELPQQRDRPRGLFFPFRFMGAQPHRAASQSQHSLLLQPVFEFCQLFGYLLLRAHPI